MNQVRFSPAALRDIRNKKEQEELKVKRELLYKKRLEKSKENLIRLIKLEERIKKLFNDAIMFEEK